MYRLLGHGSPNLIDTLSNLRKRALRKGVWFRTLTHQERVLTGLIRRHIKIVKNGVLATVIARILGKLICAIKNSFLDMIEGIGKPIAQSWSRAACAMGWTEASKWTADTDIVMWHGFMAYYFDKGRGIGFAKV